LLLCLIFDICRPFKRLWFLFCRWHSNSPAAFLIRDLAQRHLIPVHVLFSLVTVCCCFHVTFLRVFLFPQSGTSCRTYVCISQHCFFCCLLLVCEVFSSSLIQWSCVWYLKWLLVCKVTWIVIWKRCSIKSRGRQA